MSLSQSLDSAESRGVLLSMISADLGNLTDEELLARSLKNPALFEVLLTRYQHEFLGRAQNVVRSRDEAEDVVQETFVRIYRFAPKFSTANGTFRSWSLTILMNVARTRYQRVAKERGHVADLEDKHYESLPDNRSDHEEMVSRDEVESVLGLVDDETREILTLAYIEDLPYQQIADMKQTSVGAIKARVHRAKATVRNALATRGV